MTTDQFAALAALTSIRSAAPLTAARLVLVDGISPSAAAFAAGISRSQLSNVLARLREAHALAVRVCV